MEPCMSELEGRYPCTIELQGETIELRGFRELGFARDVRIRIGSYNFV